MECGDPESFVVYALPEMKAAGSKKPQREHWWSPFDRCIEVEASRNKFAVGHFDDVSAGSEILSLRVVAREH
jgi:hypothetical protein